MTQQRIKSLEVVARRIYTRDFLESQGLPEAVIEVFEEDGRPWMVLKAKDRFVFQSFPGLPKETRFLIQTMDEIALWLINQANQLPETTLDNHARKEPK